MVENFLEKKYPELPGSKPVERAAEKGRRSGETIADKKAERIQAYLNRLDRIVEDERGWQLLKNKIVKEFAIDASDQDTLAKIAHGLYESEKKLAVEQGRGADVKRLERETDVVERYKGLVMEKREIQQKTLSSWLEYLRQNDAEYPMWFRYFVIRNLQKMGIIDKERGEYTKRTDYTVAPFPELNSEALGFVYRMLTTGLDEEDFSDDQDERSRLQELIAKKDFIKLYAFAQIETTGQANRESLEGQWVKYEQGSDHHILERALRGKGTGWCTAEGSAYGHLQGGDFYVYFTKGVSGVFSEPRIAVRMEGGQVAEVRGVNHRQELEPALVDIAAAQYRSLPGGERFDKKSADMKKMTELVSKEARREQFTRDDLVFLYEINASIEGFGYERDPRITELRGRRNPKADAPVVFECRPDQIAWREQDVSRNTKAYVGPLFPGIFQLFPADIEHLYTSFPEGKVRWEEIAIGGKTAGELERELERSGFRINDYARDMLKSKEFTASSKSEAADLVRLKVGDLGFPRGATTDEIYRRAGELGLELCPAEVGPHYRLKYRDQPMGEWFWIAMKQIPGRDGRPSVFELDWDEDGLWLFRHWAYPVGWWNPEGEVVFRLRKRILET